LRISAPVGGFFAKNFPALQSQKSQPDFFHAAHEKEKPGLFALAFSFLGGFDTRTFMPSQGGYFAAYPAERYKNSVILLRSLARIKVH
jgi:hypothetical protein